MWIVRHRKIFFLISAITVSVAAAMVAVFGLRSSIEFTGGSLTELSCSGCSQQEIKQSLDSLRLGNYSLRATENGFLLRTPALSDSQRTVLVDTLKGMNASTTRAAEVGPSIGQELRRKAGIAIFLVVLAIILFIAFVFRHVSKPVSSWVYGIIAIVALLHDIIIPVGVFALLGHFVGAEIGVLFVMALLAILGYSVNDTIVVFDRIRERLRENQDTHTKEDFEETVGTALSQTITRSINTSLTTLFVLFSLYFLGGEATRYFALTLIAGIVAGTYSSIFLASPLLVTYYAYRQK